MFGSKRCVKLEAQGSYLEVPQTGQEATSTHRLRLRLRLRRVLFDL